MFFLVGIIISVLSVVSFGLDDVTPDDVRYHAIKRGVELGYFSTFENGQKFYPDRAVSRQELAVILDQLIKKSSATKPLSVAEQQELTQLAKTFKTYLVQHETGSSLLSTQFQSLQAEQDALHYDMSRLQLEVNHLEKVARKHRYGMWAALGLGVLGVLL